MDKLKNYTTKSVSYNITLFPVSIRSSHFLKIPFKTIFEINKTPASHQTALVMRKKREHHDKTVEKFKSKEFLEENVSLFQKNIYSIQNMFKNDEEKNNDEDNKQDEESDDDEENDENTTVKTFDDEELVIKITNSSDDKSDQKSDSKKGKNRNGVSKKVEKRKNRQIIDTEHFIPYKPKNFNQEKA